MTLSPNCLRLIVIVTNYNPRLAIVGMVNTLNEQDFHLLNTIPLAGRTFIGYIKTIPFYYSAKFLYPDSNCFCHAKTSPIKKSVIPLFIVSITDYLANYNYLNSRAQQELNSCYSTDLVCTVTILAMLRIPNGQNPKLEDFHTVISVPKLPTCVQ